MKLIVKDKKRKEMSNEQEVIDKGDCLRLFFLYSVILYFLIFIVSGCATTGDVKGSSIPDESRVITAIDLQDYSATVKVNKPFSYTLYKSDDPYKIIVELLDVNLGVFNRTIVSDKAGITEIVPSQIESPFMTRLEILLQTPTTADPEYKDNELKIRIREESPKGMVKTEALGTKEDVPEVTKPEPAVSESAPLQKATEITSISFEKTADIVKILVKGNGSMNPSVLPLENKIVIDISGVDMKAQLPSEVVSPLKGIRSGKNDNKIRLVFDLKEKTDFDVTTIGDTVVVALSTQMDHKPEENLEAKEPASVTENNYSGKKISLDFQDADIVPIFRLLADISGYNIVVSPEVKGKLTMKLLNVPWDQALDIILKTFSLGKIVENNIIRIAPHTAFAKESEEAAKAKESELKAVLLETKIFHISYADTSNLDKMLKDAKILSSRGNISVDKRTSSLVINDVASVFPQIENLLSTFDTPTPQVMIEARIVEVNTDEVKDLGIQWGGFITGKDPDLLYGGFSGLNTGVFTGKNFLADFPSSAGKGSGAGFTFGIMNPAKTMGLDLQLAAVETLGMGKVISNPRIMTVDNGKAKISQGKSIPFTILTPEGTPSESFKDVTLELNVQPRIAPNNSISIDIEIKKEELDFSFVSKAGTPSTDKKEAKTNVLIKDGETFVIGGIYKISKTDSEKGVPGLMKIPILGWLFKEHKEDAVTSELLIFITPRIIVVERKE